MTIGIMQPYFLPYLGYFQLMNICDGFVVYDNIKFTKKGWINRNRMLFDGKDLMFSIPLKGDSDFLNVDQRSIGDNFEKERSKTLGHIRSSYKGAPNFRSAYPVIEDIFNCSERNLFSFVYNSIVKVTGYLSIDTPLIISSTIAMDHDLKGKYRVMEICKKLGADTYVNPIGGTELYNKEEFAANGINLRFHKMRSVTYAQNGNTFIPSLSILDVMMFNDRETITGLLQEFDIINE